jgi:hypothetical protein
MADAVAEVPKRAKKAYKIGFIDNPRMMYFEYLLASTEVTHFVTGADCISI